VRRRRVDERLRLRRVAANGLSTTTEPASSAARRGTWATFAVPTTTRSSSSARAHLVGVGEHGDAGQRHSLRGAAGVGRTT
jgi:hypothetical protein